MTKNSFTTRLHINKTRKLYSNYHPDQTDIRHNSVVAVTSIYIDRIYWKSKHYTSLFRALAAVPLSTGSTESSFSISFTETVGYSLNVSVIHLL